MKALRRIGALGVVLALAALITAALASNASAHTPQATIDCGSWTIGATSYEPGQANTYSYSIDGADPVTGTFGASFSESGTFPANSGDHTLDGYVYQNGDPDAQYSHTYHLATTDCPKITTVPVPAAPAPTAPTCDAPGAVVIPDNSGPYKWTAGPGANDVTVHLIVGYAFPDGTRGPVVFTEDVLPQLTDGCDTGTPTPPVTSTTPPPATSTTPAPPATSSHPATVHTSHGIGTAVSTTLKAKPAAKHEPLASTGSQTGTLLAIAAALLMFGIGALLAAGRRRPTHR